MSCGMCAVGTVQANGIERATTSTHVPALTAAVRSLLLRTSLRHDGELLAQRTQDERAACSLSRIPDRQTDRQ
jgi:hypothetical protein